MAAIATVLGVAGAGTASAAVTHHATTSQTVATSGSCGHWCGDDEWYWCDCYYGCGGIGLGLGLGLVIDL